MFRLAQGSGGTALKAIMFSLRCRFGWSEYAPAPLRKKAALERLGGKRTWRLGGFADAVEGELKSAKPAQRISRNALFDLMPMLISGSPNIPKAHVRNFFIGREKPA